MNSWKHVNTSQDRTSKGENCNNRQLSTIRAGQAWSWSTDWGDGSGTEDHTGWDGNGDYTGQADVDLDHSYNDNATAQIIDHWNSDYTIDGQFVSGDSVVWSADILNVQPTADFHFSIDENNDNQITASLSNPTDPSQADTDAGFKYSFATNPDDLADNYGDAGTSSSATLAYSPGAVIYGRIFDQDSGYSDFSSASSVLPTINSPAVSPVGVTLAWLDPTDGQAVRWRVRRSDDGVNYSDWHETLNNSFSSYTDTTVEPGQTYYYIIRGLGAADDPNHVGQTPFSLAIQVTVPTTSPTKVVVTPNASDPTKADLSWTGTPYAASYAIMESVNGGAMQQIDTLPAGSQSDTVNNLVDGKQYTFQVQATLTSGATVSSITTPLVNPMSGGLSVSADYLYKNSTPGQKQRLSLTFDSDVHNTLSAGDLLLTNLTTGSNITVNLASYDSGSNTAIFSFNTTGGILPNGNYQLRILPGSVSGSNGEQLTQPFNYSFFFLAADFDHNRIVDVTDNFIIAQNYNTSNKLFENGDANYDGLVNQADLQILTNNWDVPFPTQSAFNVWSFSTNQINLTWDDNASSEAGWRLQWSSDGTFNSPITIPLPADTTHYEMAGLSEGTRRYFRVQPYGNGADAPYSAIQSVGTMLLGPTDLVVSPYSPTQVSLEWTDNSNNETDYVIEKSDDGVSGWTLVDTVPAGSTSDIVDGLLADSSDYYRVTAEGDITSSSSVASTSAIETLPAVPSTPSDFFANATGAHEIDLTWMGNVPGVEQYIIERSPDAIFPFKYVEIASVPGSESQYADTSVRDDGQQYSYRIKASNASGDSAVSAVVAATTLLNPPSNLHVETSYGQSFEFAWTNNSPNVRAFALQYFRSGSWTLMTGSISGNATSAYGIIPDGVPNPAQVRVVALGTANPVAPSAISDPISVPYSSNPSDTQGITITLPQGGNVIENATADTLIHFHRNTSSPQVPLTVDMDAPTWRSWRSVAFGRSGQSPIY